MARELILFVSMVRCTVFIKFLSISFILHIDGKVASYNYAVAQRNYIAFNCVDTGNIVFSLKKKLYLSNKTMLSLLLFCDVHLKSNAGFVFFFFN